jgi:hypothetical protein
MADTMFESKATTTGVSAKDLPFTIEQRGRNHFKVWAAPVLGNDADGNPLYGRELVEFASEDEVKVFEAFEAIEAERDGLLAKLAAASMTFQRSTPTPKAKI